jgi:cell division cycle protein 20 (cofactor of APC complex)
MSLRTSLRSSPSRTPPRLPVGVRATAKSPFIADRFIPKRSTVSFDYAHHTLTSEEQQGIEYSPSKVHFSRSMAENLAGSKPYNGKILHYVSKPPGCDHSGESSLKSVYRQCSSPKARRAARAIPQVPERVLDAPEVIDDFYLNLVDWGKSNQLAVGLGSAVYVWDATNGQTVQLLEMECQSDYVAAVSWCQNGHYLAVGSSQNTVQLWDVACQRRVRTMKGHSSRTQCLSWNNSMLSSGSSDGSIHHHDVRVASHLTAALSAHSQGVCGLSWSDDGKLLASGGNDNIVHIWKADATTGSEPHRTMTDHQAAVKAVSWCPWQASLLATGGGTADRSILWSREHRELISSHGFSRNQLTIWNYPSLTRVNDLEGHTGRVLCLTMSPEGSHVASLGADETLRIWSCFTQKQSIEKKMAVPPPAHSSCAVKAIRIR